MLYCFYLFHTLGPLFCLYVWSDCSLFFLFNFGPVGDPRLWADDAASQTAPQGRRAAVWQLRPKQTGGLNTKCFRLGVFDAQPCQLVAEASGASIQTSACFILHSAVTSIIQQIRLSHSEVWRFETGSGRRQITEWHLMTAQYKYFTSWSASFMVDKSWEKKRNNSNYNSPLRPNNQH